jgi:hypothetical protein
MSVKTAIALSGILKYPSERSNRKKNDLTILCQLFRGAENLTDYSGVLTEIVFGYEEVI